MCDSVDFDQMEEETFYNLDNNDGFGKSKAVSTAPSSCSIVEDLPDEDGCISEELIGDFSKPFSLPLEENCSDLKYISPETMKKLLQGKYNNVVPSYEVIDCRYPYEYRGGHLKGSINIFTEEQCVKLLQQRRDGQCILIFHCEYSIERAPALCRALRNEDRQLHADAYPTLTYPEVYVLRGGYKEFFESFPEMTSGSYTPMLHPDHRESFELYRKKSKTLKCDRKGTVGRRGRRRFL